MVKTSSRTMRLVRVPKGTARQIVVNTLTVFFCFLFSGPSPLPQFNEAVMAQLEGMGFPTIRCQKALLATGNSDPEAAMEWLFAHMEDPGTLDISDLIFPCDDDDSNLFDVDIDSPIQLSAPAAGNAGFEPDPDQVAMLSDMGFTSAQARKALRETVSPPYISSIF